VQERDDLTRGGLAVSRGEGGDLVRGHERQRQRQGRGRGRRQLRARALTGLAALRRLRRPVQPPPATMRSSMSISSLSLRPAHRLSRLVDGSHCPRLLTLTRDGRALRRRLSQRQ
jgi:hypothetical protein